MAASAQSSSMLTFTLPPPALVEQNAEAAAAADASTARTKKRRTSQPQPQAAADITLPPPPTRARKIIQMKPAAAAVETPASPSSTATKSKAKPKPKATTSSASTSTSTSTSTSRKVARKTAHSLIERRRRSKMNAEFEALKNMVCKGDKTDMHKLEILQASIEYVKYLEACIEKLQSATGSSNRCCEPPPVFSPHSHSNEQEEDEGEDEDEDVDMETQEKERPEDDHRRYSLASEYASYTTNPSSVATSPSFTPLLHSATSPEFNPVHSSTTSPVFALPPAQTMRLPSISPLLFPQTQPPVHSPLEATAGALLQLADEGRRGSRVWTPRGSTSSSGRGMSVRDLLSS